MRSPLRETIAGAPASSPRAPAALPPPRRIGHLRSVFWWIVLLLAAATYYAESVVVSSRRVTPPPPGTEREAFLAVSFGEVAEEGGEAISARTFRDQLRALRSAGYSTVGLGDLRGFFEEKRALPERPISLLFDGMQRDSIEIADRALGGLSALGAAVEGWARRPGFDGRLSPAIQDFGDVYAVEGDRPTALDIAVGPLALVGPPGG